MALLPCVVFGSGPTILIVHGVGVGPDHYLDLARELAQLGRVVVPTRPGYGSAARPTGAVSCLGQVDDLLETAQVGSNEQVLWVGVSGGASLGLVALRDRRDRVAGAFLHEPLLGPLAPALHQHVVAARDTLRHAPDPDGPVNFVAGLIGDAAWARLRTRVQPEVASMPQVIRQEVDAFVDLTFALSELVAMQCRPVVTTVGEQSPPARDAVARLLATHAGAEVEVLAGGHLAPIERPTVLFPAVMRLLGAGPMSGAVR